MARRLLYPVALDPSGRVVTVDQAAKGQAYFCPQCLERFVFRAGPKKRRHFAHKSGTASCTLESVLHQATKVALGSLLRTCLRERSACVATWTCSVCHREHSLDILAGVERVEIEYPLGDVRPDVALLDSGGKVLRVVEVVVTHEPDEVAWQAYSAANIPVFCTKADKETVEAFLRTAQGFSCYKVVGVECPTPKCPRCRTPLHKVVLVLLNKYACWRCGRPMQAAHWRTDDGWRIWEWATFLPKQALALLRSHGVKLAYASSSLVRNRYWRQVCPRCGAMLGDHFIGEYIVEQAYSEDKDGDIEEHNTAFMWCHECDGIFMGPDMVYVAKTDGASWSG